MMRRGKEREWRKGEAPNFEFVPPPTGVAGRFIYWFRRENNQKHCLLLGRI